MFYSPDLPLQLLESQSLCSSDFKLRLTPLSTIEPFDIVNIHLHRFMMWSPQISRCALQVSFLLTLPSLILLFFADQAVAQDLVPNSTVLANHDPHLLKRADPSEIYEKYRCQGEKMWARIQSAFAGHEAPGEVFPASALDNGWYKRTDTNNQRLPPKFVRYFDLELGKGHEPTAQQIYQRDWELKQDFKNRKGETVEAKVSPFRFDFVFCPSQFSRYTESNQYLDGGPNMARGNVYPQYNTRYMPVISAVVVDDMKSPINILKRLWSVNPGLHQGAVTIPSNQDLRDRYIPPLARWSDFIWTAYTITSTQFEPSVDFKKLQYFVHDDITNEDTKTTMAFIMQESGIKPNDCRFPGLVFDITTQEGLALLGTPNGMGAGWLLVDRARDLGKRSPKFRIWREGASGSMSMMGINMVPV